MRAGAHQMPTAIAHQRRHRHVNRAGRQHCLLARVRGGSRSAAACSRSSCRSSLAQEFRRCRVSVSSSTTRLVSSGRSSAIMPHSKERPNTFWCCGEGWRPTLPQAACRHRLRACRAGRRSASLATLRRARNRAWRPSRRTASTESSDRPDRASFPDGSSKYPVTAAYGCIIKFLPTRPEEFASPSGKRLDFECSNRRGVPMPFAQTITTLAPAAGARGPLRSM